VQQIFGVLHIELNLNFLPISKRHEHGAKVDAIGGRAPEAGACWNCIALRDHA
jgi:hypothetical protein